MQLLRDGLTAAWTTSASCGCDPRWRDSRGADSANASFCGRSIRTCAVDVPAPGRLLVLISGTQLCPRRISDPAPVGENVLSEIELGALDPDSVDGRAWYERSNPAATTPGDWLVAVH
jgi:hypothetical protein